MLLLPQRYEFSSKSQLASGGKDNKFGCCCYRKGTNFQANHNGFQNFAICVLVVVATAKVRIFKQITTWMVIILLNSCCCCYRKGTNFQANHNYYWIRCIFYLVVVATAKVRIFKQITTYDEGCCKCYPLLLLPQRYEFSSKSQPSSVSRR